MAQLSPEVKMRVATREITLPQALADAGLEIPEWLRTGASAPADAPVAPGDVDVPRPGRIRRRRSSPSSTRRRRRRRSRARPRRRPPGSDTQPRRRRRGGCRPHRSDRSEGGKARGGAAQAGAHAAPAVGAQAAGRQARDQPRGRHARGWGSSRSEHQDRARRRRWPGRPASSRGSWARCWPGWARR